jgi:hypothetical protein
MPFSIPLCMTLRNVHTFQKKNALIRAKYISKFLTFRISIFGVFLHGNYVLYTIKRDHRKTYELIYI